MTVVAQEQVICMCGWGKGFIKHRQIRHKQKTQPKGLEASSGALSHSQKFKAKLQVKLKAVCHNCMLS